jgi:hypothetical protein
VPIKQLCQVIYRCLLWVNSDFNDRDNITMKSHFTGITLSSNNCISKYALLRIRGGSTETDEAVDQEGSQTTATRQSPRRSNDEQSAKLISSAMLSSPKKGASPTKKQSIETLASPVIEDSPEPEVCQASIQIQASYVQEKPRSPSKKTSSPLKEMQRPPVRASPRSPVKLSSPVKEAMVLDKLIPKPSSPTKAVSGTVSSPAKAMSETMQSSPMKAMSETMEAASMLSPAKAAPFSSGSSEPLADAESEVISDIKPKAETQLEGAVEMDIDAEDNVETGSQLEAINMPMTSVETEFHEQVQPTETEIEDMQLVTSECAQCSKYRLQNEELKAQLREAKEALITNPAKSGRKTSVAKSAKANTPMASSSVTAMAEKEQSSSVPEETSSAHSVAEIKAAPIPVKLKTEMPKRTSARVQPMDADELEAAKSARSNESIEKVDPADLSEDAERIPWPTGTTTITQ